MILSDLLLPIISQHPGLSFPNPRHLFVAPSQGLVGGLKYHVSLIEDCLLILARGGGFDTSISQGLLNFIISIGEFQERSELLVRRQRRLPQSAILGG
jgi:hypothetical protein